MSNTEGFVGFLKSKGFELNYLNYQNVQYLLLKLRNLNILYFQYFLNIQLFNRITEKHPDSIRIWSDQWERNQPVIESRINNLLQLNTRIPARVCRLQKIDKLQSVQFLEENHLQGSTKAKSHFGLFLPQSHYRFLPQEMVPESETLLLAVMSFNQPRRFKKEDKTIVSHEMVRFATTKNLSIIGGLDKFLKHYEENYQPDELMTYIDADWSNGQNFIKLGFQIVGKTEPMGYKLDLKNKRVRFENEKDCIWNSGSWKLKKYYNEQK